MSKIILINAALVMLLVTNVGLITSFITIPALAAVFGMVYGLFTAELVIHLVSTLSMGVYSLDKPYTVHNNITTNAKLLYAFVIVLLLNLLNFTTMVIIAADLTLVWKVVGYLCVVIIIGGILAVEYRLVPKQRV